MNILFFILLLIASTAHGAQPDYDAAIQAIYPTAISGVNYKIGYTAVDNLPFISYWAVDKSTPDLAGVLAAYNASAAKATLTTEASQAKLKLNLSDTDIAGLKVLLLK